MKKFFFVLAAFLFSAQAFGSNVTVGALSETPVLLGASAVDTAGNSVYNYNENVILYFKNTDGASSASVTIVAQSTSQNIPGYGPVTKSNITQTLAAGAEYVIGPFPAQAFNNSNQQIIISYGGAIPSALTIAAFKSTKLLKIP